MCELIVNPSDIAPVAVSQSELFLGARIGVTPSSAGPNKRSCSEAKKGDATRAVLSASAYCT